MPAATRERRCQHRDEESDPPGHRHGRRAHAHGREPDRGHAGDDAHGPPRRHAGDGRSRLADPGRHERGGRDRGTRPERRRRADSHRSAQTRPLMHGHDGGADERGRRPGAEHRRVERAGIEVQAAHNDEVRGVALDDRDRERVGHADRGEQERPPGRPEVDQRQDHGHHHDDGAVERQRRREERAGEAHEDVQSRGAAARPPGQHVCDPAGEARAVGDVRQPDHGGQEAHERNRGRKGGVDGGDQSVHAGGSLPYTKAYLSICPHGRAHETPPTRWPPSRRS